MRANFEVFKVSAWAPLFVELFPPFVKVADQESHDISGDVSRELQLLY